MKVVSSMWVGISLTVRLVFYVVAAILSIVALRVLTKQTLGKEESNAKNRTREVIAFASSCFFVVVALVGLIYMMSLRSLTPRFEDKIEIRGQEVTINKLSKAFELKDDDGKVVEGGQFVGTYQYDKDRNKGYLIATDGTKYTLSTEGNKYFKDKIKG